MRQRSVRPRFSASRVATPSPSPRRVLIASLQVNRVVTPKGHIVLRPVGELESATVPNFRRAVAEIGHDQSVIIDMAGVPFLDSCGIGALIGAVRRVREIGGSVTVAAVRPPVQRVLNLTGVDRIVQLAETVEQAAASIDGGDTVPRSHRDPVAI